MTSSFIYFKKYTIKLNSRNTIFGYSTDEPVGILLISRMESYVLTEEDPLGFTLPIGDRMERIIFKNATSMAQSRALWMKSAIRVFRLPYYSDGLISNQIGLRKWSFQVLHSPTKTYLDTHSVRLRLLCCST